MLVTSIRDEELFGDEKPKESPRANAAVGSRKDSCDPDTHVFELR